MICAIGGKCPCDPQLCPCPPKKPQPNDPPYDCCPAPRLCGPAGVGLGGGLITLIVLAAILTWSNSPFAALALLLLLIPLTITLGIALAVMGRWGKKATRTYPFVPAYWLVFLLLGALSLLAALGAVITGEILGSVPLAVMGALWIFVGMRKRATMACRLMPWTVILGLILGMLVAAGFGLAALIDGNEPYAGIGMLTIAFWLGLALVIPWMLVCRAGASNARIFPGVGLIFMFWFPVLFIAFVLLIVNGIPGDSPAVVTSGGTISSTSTSTSTSTTTTVDDAAADAEEERLAEEAAAEEKRIADEQAAEEKKLADEKVAEEELLAQEEAQKLEIWRKLAEAFNVSNSDADQIWEARNPHTPNWVTTGELPDSSDMVRPNLVSWSGLQVGLDLVVLLEFDTILVPPIVQFSGTQLGLRRWPNDGGTDPAEADEAYFLVPGEPVEGYSPKEGFAALNAGSGGTSDAFAIYVVPWVDGVVGIDNFFRYTAGEEAADTDPTGTDRFETNASGGTLTAR